MEDLSIVKHHGLTVLHAHEGTPEYDEAWSAVLHNMYVHPAAGFIHLASIPDLRDLLGERIIKEPEEGFPEDRIHKGALNFAFRNPFRV